GYYVGRGAPLLFTPPSFWGGGGGAPPPKAALYLWLATLATHP
ncbi:hypothetical protein FHR22_003956, partial [Sphingopyxis panaciterrae]|nr:hypothetical protein [Sphingopyxis panaciterrae]